MRCLICDGELKKDDLAAMGPGAVMNCGGCGRTWGYSWGEQGLWLWDEDVGWKMAPEGCMTAMGSV